MNGIVPQSLTVYMSSYSHLSALVAGVTFGYFFYKYREQTAFTNKVTQNYHISRLLLYVFRNTLTGFGF
jgi:ABC-type methionine transport system permease subunit